MMSCRKSFCRQTLAWLALVLTLPAHAEPVVLGWLESAYLQPWGIRVRAKLDTGARTSSLHAEKIEPFEKDGEGWVRFHMPFGAKSGYADGLTVELPVVRETLIKEHEGESMSRYVVNIDVCVSGKTYKTPVSLADRSNFNYPMILGRLMLKGNILVDAGKSFQGARLCPGATKKSKKKTAKE